VPPNFFVGEWLDVCRARGVSCSRCVMLEVCRARCVSCSMCFQGPTAWMDEPNPDGESERLPIRQADLTVCP